MDDGLICNSIISIYAEYDSSVWVATEKDICRFDGRAFTSNILPAALTMKREGGSLHVTQDGTLWINKSSREWKRRAISGVLHPQLSANNFGTVRYIPDRNPPETKITTYSEEVGKECLALLGMSPEKYLILF